VTLQFGLAIGLSTAGVNSGIFPRHGLDMFIGVAAGHRVCHCLVRIETMFPPFVDLHHDVASSTSG
jgi:hypothetical protein